MCYFMAGVAVIFLFITFNFKLKRRTTKEIVGLSLSQLTQANLELYSEVTSTVTVLMIFFPSIQVSFRVGHVDIKEPFIHHVMLLPHKVDLSSK